MFPLDDSVQTKLGHVKEDDTSQFKVSTAKDQVSKSSPPAPQVTQTDGELTSIVTSMFHGN